MDARNPDQRSSISRIECSAEITAETLLAWLPRHVGVYSKYDNVASEIHLDINVEPSGGVRWRGDQTLASWLGTVWPFLDTQEKSKRKVIRGCVLPPAAINGIREKYVWNSEFKWACEDLSFFKS